jgi:protein-disulfide isomerase
MARLTRHALALALVVPLGLVACQGGSEAETGTAIVGQKQTSELFAGIPQSGVTLGKADAPVTLVEFADLQCPYCADFANDVLPTIVERYVRPGKVKIVFRNLAFLGPDSVRAARMAAAAGLQNKLYDFTELFFRNQGGENSGYVTDAFLGRLAGAVPHLDGKRAMAKRDDPAAIAQLEEAKKAAERFGIDGTPSFLVGKTGETPHRLEASELTPEAFSAQLDRALHGANAAP